MAAPIYHIRRARRPPRMDGKGNDPAWAHAEIARVAQFRPESSDHRPQTEARLLHDDENIHGLFRVRDRFVRCVHRGFQSPVYLDSCVEFFAQPRAGGYFNFEMNCGGALLCHFIRDPERTADGFKDFEKLPEAKLRQVEIHTSLPSIVDPEIASPTEWHLEFRIPLALLESYSGPLRPLAGQDWRGNFYKCGDGTSHPHWAAWAPVDERNFHLPRCFGTLHYEA